MPCRFGNISKSALVCGQVSIKEGIQGMKDTVKEGQGKGLFHRSDSLSACARGMRCPVLTYVMLSGS